MTKFLKLRIIFVLLFFWPLAPAYALQHCEFLYFFKMPRTIRYQELMAVNKFLKKIAVLESSFYKNTKHTVLQFGIHQGTAALGHYGLMPLTVKELIQRCLPVLPPSERLLFQRIKPHFIIFDWELENKVAKSLAFFILRRMNFNFEKAAFAWLKGHNLINVPKNYPSHWYVQKFKKVNYVD